MRNAKRVDGARLATVGHRRGIVEHAVRQEADGLTRSELEVRACQARTRAASIRASRPDVNRPIVAEVWAAELGRILIYLRANELERYELREHEASLAANQADPIALDDARSVRLAGHPVGGQVEILGDDRTGTVQQVQVRRDPSGELARWYVVHVAELRVCRAYGCDELESVSDAEQVLAIAG